MQKLTITGITKNNPKNIVWGGMPSGSLLLIRNRTSDDTISVMQTIPLPKDEFGVTNYKEVTTPIRRNEEHSFLVEDTTLPFEIQTETNYSKTGDPNCITAIVLNNENNKQDNLNVWVVNLVSEKALVNNTTIENKGIAYLQAVEFNVKTESIPQDEFPNPKTSTDTRLIQKTNYTAYLGAGRGYLLKNIKGIEQGTGSNKDTKEILKQVESYTHLQNSAGDSTNIEIETAEVPYIPKFVKNDILTFDKELKKVYNDGQTFIEYPKAMGELMFQVQVSKANGLSVLNNKPNSNITKLSTVKSPDDSTKEIYTEHTTEGGETSGYYGDGSDVLDTRMWVVSDKSQYQWWQDRFEPQKLKLIAFTIQTMSQEYPYTIAFTAPLLGGITFLSDSSIKLHLGNRETLYNGINHLYKTLRIVMNYEADYLQLYLNGDKIEHESQSATTFTNKETNTFGADVKSAYTHEERSLNLLAQVIGAKASLEVTAETLNHNADNDLIEPNDYTISYKRNSTTSAQVFLLPKSDNISGRNTGIVPLGSITDNGLAEVTTEKFFMLETASSAITAMNFKGDKTEDALYAIGVEDAEPSIEIVTASVASVASVAVSKDEAVELYAGVGKYATQTPAYRYKFLVKALQMVNATATVRLSWTGSTGKQTKDISVTIKEA